MAKKMPEVWSYRDARAFVRDHCAWRLQHESGFSYRQLSRHADLGSPNYVQMFVSGKRNIKTETAWKLAEAMLLSPRAAEFFVKLVTFTQAEAEVRPALLDELLKFAVRHGGMGQLDAARLEYFRHWYIPVVHAMASLQGFRADPHWIAARVVPKIRSFDAKQALDVLFTLGIFVEDADGFRVEEPRLETEQGLQSLLIREYHRNMIHLSESALDTWRAWIGFARRCLRGS